MATLCLNMIVRNEAHIITETLDCVAPLIDCWVIVDTGSTDGTEDLIERYFAARKIPGELHRRPWHNFGENRTEALQLCAGRADYVWVIDADDLVVGELSLPELKLDSYALKYGQRFRYWRKQIFVNDGSWSYKGVVHEYPVSDRGARAEGHIEGDYHIDSRRLGDRNRSGDKYQRDIKLLLGALGHDPDNARNVFYLAQSYFDAGTYGEALLRYRQRAKMGDWKEEVYYALARVASCLEQLGRPWCEVLEAYLLAHEQSPTRAEPLHWIAQHYRLDNKFQLGYQFARLASEIPYPNDALFVDKEVYDYRARDEWAISAFYVGRHRESFELCRDLFAGELPNDQERSRIMLNRDFAVEKIKDETLVCPKEKVQELVCWKVHQKQRSKAVTLTITACKRLELFCSTVNSFLHCCTDIDRIGRFICIDDNSSGEDRAAMVERYPFFEFVMKDEASKGHAQSMNDLLTIVDSPYWLHLEDDWHFFDKRPYVSQALEILAHDERLGQVLFNNNYGEVLESRNLIGGQTKQTPDGLRYRRHQYIARDTDAYRAFFADKPPGALSNVHWPHFSLQPSMMRAEAVRKLGRFAEAGHFELEFAARYMAAGLRSAFFGEITCLHMGRRTWERDDPGKPNAYQLNQQKQF